MFKSLFTFSGIVITLFCCAQSQSNSNSLFLSVPAETRDSLLISNSKAIEQADFYFLDNSVLKKIMADRPDLLTLTITENNIPFQLVLNKREIVSPDFKITTSSRSPAADKAKLNAVCYGGYVSGDKNSVTAFTFADNQVAGMVMNDKGNYVLGPVQSDFKTTPGPIYVFYNDKNLKVKNPFKCSTNDEKDLVKKSSFESSRSMSSACKKVRIYLEADYPLYQSFGSVNFTSVFVAAMFNTVKELYQRDGINMEMSELKVWDTQSIYPQYSSSDGLSSFGANLQYGFNGDLAQLICLTGFDNGGKGWINVLCSDYDPFTESGPFSYADIHNTFAQLPTYSWTVEVVAHEMGHNLGSRHTHYCGWQLQPGVFGAIDSCSYVEEDSTGHTCYYGPEIPRVGTIMSYCHLTQAGIDLNLGFGPLPAGVINYIIEHSFCLPATSSIAQPVAVNNGPYCVGDRVTLSLADPSFKNVTWSGPNGFHSSLSQPSFIADDLGENGIYRATVTNDTCSSSDTTMVKISSSPPISAVNYYTGNILLPVLNSPHYLYQWYRNGELLQGANTAQLTASTDGMYAVKITNTGGCSTFSLPYQVGVTGIEESVNPIGKIYGEMADNNVVVQLDPSICTGSLLFTLTDIAGRNILAQTMSCEMQTQRVNISQLSAGIYIASLSKQGQVKLQNKIVKK